MAKSAAGIKPPRRNGGTKDENFRLILLFKKSIKTANKIGLIYFPRVTTSVRRKHRILDMTAANLAANDP